MASPYFKYICLVFLAFLIGCGGGGGGTKKSQFGENERPFAKDLNVGLDEDSSKLISFLTEDKEGDEVDLIIASNPMHGSLSVSNNKVTYIPNPDYFGNDSFSYRYDDGFDLGNIGNVNIIVDPLNDKPTLSVSNINTDEDVVVVNNTDWASDWWLGPVNELETATFTVVNNTNPSLFSVQPTINPNGHLSYTPVADVFGVAELQVELSDGDLTADLATFMITINAINDRPSLSVSDINSNEDVAVTDNTDWVVNWSLGPANELETGTFTIVDNTNPDLFAVQPAINPNGHLSYTPVADVFGVAELQVELSDGDLATDIETFTLTVNSINDRPTLSVSDINFNEDVAVTDNTDWVTNWSLGPANELETATFTIVDNTNPGLFAVQPAINSNGQLNYAPVTDVFGVAELQVALNDGELFSEPQLLTITVEPINDAPVITIINPVSGQSNNVIFSIVLEDIESDVCSVEAEYSIDNGVTWSDAQLIGQTSGIMPSTSPHALVWNAGADLTGFVTENAILRVRAIDSEPGQFTNSEIFSVSTDGGNFILLHVDTTASGGNNGSSWDHAFVELRDALALSVFFPSNDIEIWVAKGTYKPGNNRADTFQLLTNTSLYGGFSGNEVVRSERNWVSNTSLLSGDLLGNSPSVIADDVYHVVTGASHAILDGFTISYGNADNSAVIGRGGGLYNDAQSLNLKNCIFTYNVALHSGGAIYCKDSIPDIADCIFTNNSTSGSGGAISFYRCLDGSLSNSVFENNSAYQGGGLGFVSGTSATLNFNITDCTINKNSADRGGGLYVDSYDLTISVCEVINNIANDQAGGIFIQSSNDPVTITNSRINNNYGRTVGALSSRSPLYLDNCEIIDNVGLGTIGAIAVSGDVVAIEQCEISGNKLENSDSGSGGGIFVDATNFTMKNSSIYGNSAASGGGIYFSRPGAVVTNCILSNNSANEGGGVYCGSGSSPAMINCTITGNHTKNESSSTVYNYVSNTTFINCIVSDNYINSELILLYDNEISSTWDSVPVLSYSMITGITVGDGNFNINDSPHFIRPVGKLYDDDPGDLRLRHESLARDSGLNGVNSEIFDISNNDRILNAVIDIGAYEFNSSQYIFVDIDALGGNDGTSWTDAFTDLQDALSTTVLNPIIWIAEGTYTPDMDIASGGSRLSTFLLIEGSSLFGGFSATENSLSERSGGETILSGDLNGDTDIGETSDDVVHVVTGADNSVLNGLTVKFGNSTIAGEFTGGGGIYNHNVERPIVTSCIITSNLGGYKGAGIYNKDADALITECIIQGNMRSSTGGGMYNERSDANVINCRFVSNQATDAGAVCNEYCEDVNYIGCIFEFNTCTTHGGSVYNHNSTASFLDCVIKNNQADKGGGVFNYESESSFLNCHIIDNYAEGKGAGIYSGINSNIKLVNTLITGNSCDAKGGAIYNHFQSDSTLLNCTITENGARTEGAAIYNFYGCYSDLTNCIIWGNKIDGVDTSSVAEEIHDDSSITAMSFSLMAFINVGVSNISGNPLFMDALNGDYTLDDLSPAIDTGDNSVVTEDLDITGDPRISDGPNDVITTPVVDMGAYEAPPSGGG